MPDLGDDRDELSAARGIYNGFRIMAAVFIAAFILWLFLK